MEQQRATALHPKGISLPLLSDRSFASSILLHHGVILQDLAEVSYHVIVVIHHYAKWLADNETRPHHDIAQPGAPLLLHLLT